MSQNASEFQTWKSRPQLIHMQYAMLNEASGASDAPRLAKWQSIVMALQLSEEQKERLLAARTYLLAQMMEIIQERTLIISMLQVCLTPPYPTPQFFLKCTPVADSNAHAVVTLSLIYAVSSNSKEQGACSRG